MSATQTLVAVVATLAAVGAIFAEHTSPSGAADELLTAGIAAGVTVGMAVLVFVGAVPRAKTGAAQRSGQTALVTSLIGFFSVASAWTGLPFVLGTGGAMLGTEARRNTSDGRQRGIARFAVAIGIGAVVMGCVTLAVL